MFGKSLLNTVVISSFGALALSSAANAALTVDLRFTDGSHGKSINVGDLTPITIQAWAVATGTTGNVNEEGLQSLILAVKSSIASAGITGNITSAALGTGWNGSGSNLGSSSNISADGIGDWGNQNNTPLSIGGTNFFRPRTTKSVNNAVDWGDGDSPAGSVHTQLADGGDEFLVGTFTFTPTAAALGGILKYAPSTPLGGTVAPAGWYEDTADKTAGSPTGVKSQATGSFGPAQPNAALTNAVTLTVVPEPTSLGFLGLGALAALRRRRA